jgi:hypothetical protein
MQGRDTLVAERTETKVETETDESTEGEDR